MYFTTLNLSNDQLEYLKNKKVSDATLLEFCMVLDNLLSENYGLKGEGEDSSIVDVWALTNNYYFTSIAGYNHYKTRVEKGLARYAREHFPELNSDGYIPRIDLSKISESKLWKIEGLGQGTFRVIVSMIQQSGYILQP